jgi:uncharacterized repeat protein (TIGR01451 family)
MAYALGPNAIRAGFNSTAFPGNDDGSIAVSLPFTVNFFNANYNSLFLNNNGNVTFDSALSNFTPFDLASAGRVIIAAFFADVDTRVGATAAYGSGTVNGRPAWGVTWPGVGCYNGNTSVLNNFQLLLINRSDIAAGDFDIEFNYDRIQWDSGQASGGDGSCLGGSAARAGYSNGTSANSFELPGSAVNNAFLDSNTSTGLIHHSLNNTQLGRYVFAVRGGQPVPQLSTSIVDTPDPVTAGSNVKYTVTVRNTDSESSVSGVQVTDTLPAGTTFVSRSANCTGTGPVTCSLGTINAGASKSVYVEVRTSPGSGGTNITDSATTTPGGSTGSSTTHVNAPTGTSVSGHVDPGGSITTGGTNPATLALPPSGPGANVTINVVNVGTFCNTPNPGIATFINSIQGYNDATQPIDLKLTLSHSTLAAAQNDLNNFVLYHCGNGVITVVPNCSQSGIANPAPCITRRFVTQRPPNWQTTFEILFLSPGSGWLRH